MAAVKGVFSGVWTYGVCLPAYLFKELIFGLFGLFGWVAGSFLPHGYKPCNELADGLADACANSAPHQAVRLPWIDSKASLSRLLDGSDRLLAYTAIKSGWFGVAVKEAGKGGVLKSTYRYYYRRSLTGNWFAEIWSVPKSAIISAGLGISCFQIIRDVMGGHVDSHDGLSLMVAGLLLVICFLPRAILGRKTHLASIAPINCTVPAAYGCAQVINWCSALAGLSYIWLGMGLDWNVGAFTGNVVDTLGHWLWMLGNTIERHGLFLGLPLDILSLIAFVLVGMAFTALPALVFWGVSLRYVAARRIKARLESLPINAVQSEMYLTSTFAQLSDLRAPQISLGYLVYIVMTITFFLAPITQSVASWF